MNTLMKCFKLEDAQGKLIKFQIRHRTRLRTVETLAYNRMSVSLERFIYIFDFKNINVYSSVGNKNFPSFQLLMSTIKLVNTNQLCIPESRIKVVKRLPS